MSTIIETDVPMPQEETTPAPAKPKKTRARKAISDPAKVNPAAGLIAALKFVAIAQKKAGTIGQQHCYMGGNWVAASNEVLTIATRIEEDIRACPHTLSLIEALGQVESDDLRIIQLSEETLAVESGKFKGLIQCAEFEEVSISGPDENIARIDDRIKFAFEVACIPVVDGAPNPVFGAVLLQANSAAGTNGHMLLEAWHGIDLPPGLLIPKSSAVAIARCPKKLTGFGYSRSSVTFWFEDGSFIKTQLYDAQYPNFEKLLNVETNPWPLPAEFFKGVHAIENLSEKGNVFFKNGFLLSGNFFEEASTYRIDGLPDRFGFNIKYLCMVEPYMKAVHFQENEAGNKVFFFGQSVRGILMGVLFEDKEKARYDRAEVVKGPDFSDMEDDIPY